MPVFVGEAREQVERILGYLAAPGSSALIDLSAGTVVLTAGSAPDPTRLLAAALRARDDDSVIFVDEDARCVVGQIAHGFALVLEVDRPLLGSPTLVERTQKACALLARMIVPPGTTGVAPPESGGGGSGAPSHVAVFVPAKSPPD